LKCTAANSLWLAGCLSESARFHRALRRVAAEQRDLLLHLLRANQETEFGRAHGFARLGSVREYQQRVPLRDFDEYHEWIDRAAAGNANVLTRDPVQLFEPTGGSSGAAKLVPCTRSLQQEFQRAIRAWIADLFLHDPQLLGGQAYWSVSPHVTVGRRTSGGIPVGFDDDASYLGGWQQRLVETVMAVPSAIRSVSDIDSFRYLALRFLVQSEHLALVSIWNPTFLSLLVERLPLYGDELAFDLEQGTARGNIAVPDNLRRRLRQDSRRAALLRASLRAPATERHQMLWPRLRLISCWADANAAAPAAQLQTQFPQAKVQGKGLVATEGFVSLPLIGHEGSALALRSHFLEFLPADSAGEVDRANPQLADELETGALYAVVLTTGGGFYRYQLDDLVEVTGRIHGCPLVRFRGKRGHVSDWFGEKLNEAHVAATLHQVFDSLALKPAFAMLACNRDPPPPGYVLYIDTAAPGQLLDRAVAQIETGLQANFHYRYARELGQLAPLRVFRAEGAAATYISRSIRNGQREGNIKPLALDRRDGWSRVFQGRFVDSRQMPAGAR
jgi:GH3 auxin-responsive promoter